VRAVRNPGHLGLYGLRADVLPGLPGRGRTDLFGLRAIDQADEESGRSPEPPLPPGPAPDLRGRSSPV